MRKGLCEICSPKQWKTISTDLLTGTGYPVYGANGVIGYYSEYNHTEPTLLITCRGATCGMLNICKPYSYVNGNAMALDNLTPDVNISYLYYYLQNRGFKDVITGSAQPQIVRQSLEKVQIYYPDLQIQTAIVSLLDKVSDLIYLRKQQLAKLDELVKSRFVELFGDPVSNPNGWKTEKAETHIDLLSGFPFDSSQYTESGVNICGGLIIMPQRIKWNDCKHWCSIEGYEEYTLKTNDIVIALDRPWISEGLKIAMVDAEHLPALLIQRTARIRAIGINQFYLMYCFLLGGFDKHCNVTGSLVPHISAKDIRSFSIMLPPLELQEQFATFVKQTDKSKLTIQQSLNKLETLKKALMQEYFG